MHTGVGAAMDAAGFLQVRENDIPKRLINGQPGNGTPGRLILLDLDNVTQMRPTMCLFDNNTPMRLMK